MILKKEARFYSSNSYQCNEIISYLILREVFKKNFYLNAIKKSEIDGYCLGKDKDVLIENKIRINDSLDKYETSICEAKKIDKILRSNYINHKEVWIFTYYKDGVLIDKINDLKDGKYQIFDKIISNVENFGDKKQVIRENYIFKTNSQIKKRIDLSYYIELSRKYCYECDGNLENTELGKVIIQTIVYVI